MCQDNTPPDSQAICHTASSISSENPFSTIGDIPCPSGYVRVLVVQHSFAEWLRKLKLKKNKTVYQYNGLPKDNQEVQFAVINISTGKKDLQQCADAIIRLRAEYYFQYKQYYKIRFTDNANVVYSYSGNENRQAFEQYIEKVFAHCGTLSLEKQMHKRKSMQQAQIGDVLIKGGSPGHAMIIMDMAMNKDGKKIFLLAQSYMPAQDMHVVKNPGNRKVSPWYLAENEAPITTPEWQFEPTHLRYW